MADDADEDGADAADPGEDPAPAGADPPATADPEAGADRGAGGDPHAGAERPPPEVYYEEVTLADLALTLWDHRRAALAVLALVFLGTVAGTALQEPVYEATAKIVPTQEEDVILAVLGSDHYAAHVAEELGLVEELGDGDPRAAGRALSSQVAVESGAVGPGGSKGQLVRVTASSQDPRRAADVANAYVTKVDWARSLLENATYDRNWKQYYEEADKNASQARSELVALVQGYTYYRPLDTASAPEEPSSPDWGLNLALGGTLGLMLGFMTPFVLEAGANVRAELEDRRD